MFINKEKTEGIKIVYKSDGTITSSRFYIPVPEDDINVLNQKINEVENELSLTNIRLSTDIENVSNNLNSYANNQANTTIANTTQNIISNEVNNSSKDDLIDLL